MTYNGWSNRATWNVALWLNNEEGLYHETLRLLRYSDAEDRLKEFCEELWTDRTPDGDALSEVDWVEIVESYDEEREETLADDDREAELDDMAEQ